ncbi:MAG TPA: filamentous hemagglutinin [Cyanobacteria bacterium UBA11369]|nr:filamentous hemagglutinin [Cyanobacteria bacterium UBA11371]HBE31001.1 filamentous hemagglutinin [Cyanobacteria bacterium UBA11368]HBE48089.1 filamentous hemagglutinin [Cyanobacteria bacterium UBA11369]
MAIPYSLVMTVYNRSRYLSTAIESVLRQTKRDFELLIWDDGSTDGSVEIACDYAQRDKRVRVVAAEHQGLSRSLKAAIAQTTGDYIGWVDSDDALAPTALEETTAVLDAYPEVGLVYTDYMVMDEHGKVRGYGQRCRIPYSKERLLIDFTIFHFRLMRRSVYDLVGGIDETFERAQDYDLCLRLSEVTQVQQVKKPLYYYRHYPENISHQQRMQQIMCSAEAVKRAIARRGLSDRFELDVQIVSRFSLRPKQSA